MSLGAVCPTSYRGLLLNCGDPLTSFTEDGKIRLYCTVDTHRETAPIRS